MTRSLRRGLLVLALVAADPLTRARAQVAGDGGTADPGSAVVLDDGAVDAGAAAVPGTTGSNGGVLVPSCAP